MTQMEQIKTDVLVIGSGGAGMRAAIAAADQGASVLLVTKGKAGVSGATVTAIADVSVDSKSAAERLNLPGDRSDSPEQFMEDMIQGGAGLNNVRLVERFVHEVPARVEELLAWGAKVRNFSVSPGHRYPRAVIINGKDFALTLLRQVRSRSKIQILEQTAVLDLHKEDGQITGAWALNLATGQYVSISAKATVLATGGAMNVFPITTAPNDLLGDGIAMGARAGTSLRDMEFQTFMLGCASPESLRGNNYPYVLVCRCGGQLLNREGERFLTKTDPVRMEKTTRDKLAIAAAKEILEGRGGPNQGVWVSIRHIPRNVFAYYQQWYESSLGFETFDPKTFLPDLCENAIEAIPAAHFWCGGISIDEQCSTGLPGLFAAGECTGGLHGANRLSGNAMAEIITMGAIAGENAAQSAMHLSQPPAPPNQYFEEAERILTETGGEDAVALKHLLQKTAWETAGPLRSETGCLRALETISDVRRRLSNVGLSCKTRVLNREWMDALSLPNLCDILEAVIRSAQIRRESRGSHFRSDYPDSCSQLFFTQITRKGTAQTAEIHTM